MAPVGLLHDKLDFKLLVLYLLNRAAGPVQFTELSDLVMDERGADYFLFAEAVSELVKSGHLTAEDGQYAITEKGRRNSAQSASTLPPMVRQRGEERLSALNKTLRRRAQVQARVEENKHGGAVLTLSLNDGSGNLMDLKLQVGALEEAREMAVNFRAHPEQVYHGVLEAVGAMKHKKQTK